MANARRYFCWWPRVATCVHDYPPRMSWHWKRDVNKNSRALTSILWCMVDDWQHVYMYNEAWKIRIPFRECPLLCLVMATISSVADSCCSLTHFIQGYITDCSGASVLVLVTLKDTGEIDRYQTAKIAKLETFHNYTDVLYTQNCK